GPPQAPGPVPQPPLGPAHSGLCPSAPPRNLSLLRERGRASRHSLHGRAGLGVPASASRDQKAEGPQLHDRLPPPATPPRRVASRGSRHGPSPALLDSKGP